MMRPARSWLRRRGFTGLRRWKYVPQRRSCEYRQRRYARRLRLSARNPAAGTAVRKEIFGDGTMGVPSEIFAMTIGDGNTALRAIMGGKDRP
jgi:hypothetical protein